MTVRELTMEGLRHVDRGTVEVALNQKLRQAIADCDDRPGLDKKRKVTLEVTLVPQTLQDGSVCDVEIEVEIKSTLPAQASQPVRCAIRKTPTGLTAAFDDLSQDDPNQRTIDMGDDE